MTNVTVTSGQNIKKALIVLSGTDIVIPPRLASVFTKSQRVADSRLSLAGIDTAILEADTPEAFASAVENLQRALAYDSIDGPKLKQHVNRLFEAELVNEFYPVADDLVADVAAAYNAAAPDFSAAVARIPDLTGRGPADMSPEEAQALADARIAVSRLNAYHTAYEALMVPLGHRAERGSTPESASIVVARLGTGFDDDSHHEAVSLVYGYARGADNLALKALAPHVAIVRVGGSLHMVHPEEAESRLILKHAPTPFGGGIHFGQKGL